MDSGRCEINTKTLHQIEDYFSKSISYFNYPTEDFRQKMFSVEAEKSILNIRCLTLPDSEDWCSIQLS
ncbi:hypothetical protein V202x_41780 [Gimesia aquarii]|uniref:Uncharacterized protein n=1 Tax=Gimesia aquarii TaxID=2527964 RepID=A0A517WZT8_9PLAN|nr:hypothetical protein V202x_41780 [Gimesia aquarii]